MNFGKEIKRAIRTAEGRRRIFFRFFLLIVLGNVFYFPEGYADRFFTPGMLWTGIAVGVSGMLFPFVVSGRVGLPGLACVAVGILAVVGGKSAGGFFAWQTAAWGGAMWLLFVMTGYFSAWGKPADWYGGLSFVGAVEAFAGIGPYAGIWPVYSASFPVTGTFDNPAGLAACLAICFPAALYFMASRPVGAKVWGGLSALSMGAAVVLSGSRTGMVAVGCLAATSVYRFFLGGRWPAWRVRAAFVSVGAVMLVGLYCWKKDSADGRLLVWNCSLEMLADAPLTGHGPDAFQAEYMDYQAGWLAELASWLEGGKPARSFDFDEGDDAQKAVRKELGLLSAKPVIYACNVGEDDLLGGLDENPYFPLVAARAKEENAQAIPICAKTEEDIAGSTQEEKIAFLQEMGIESTGLDKLIKASYELLGLISFLTDGKKECRAWTIKRGTKAPQAAGKIHSDFERGFIRAQVIAYKDLEDADFNYAAVKSKGLQRTEGKEYVVNDGDVIEFLFNV